MPLRDNQAELIGVGLANGKTINELTAELDLDEDGRRFAAEVYMEMEQMLKDGKSIDIPTDP